MSSSIFRRDKHVLPCQHIRGYPHGTVNEEQDVLHFAINQYTPLDNPNPRSGDVTLIAAHANGVGKELYEPLWDELYARAKERGVRIRGIWMADVSFQGESGVLNEGKLGNDPSWFDHPRDLLHMVNHFRKQMPRPIVGVGHSMGGNNVTNLALAHPRLIESLILIDPVIQRWATAEGNYAPAYMSTFRRDIWPSREAAAATFRKNKFYQSWDPRVLDLWIEHGLRELPTAIYPTYPVTSSDQAKSTSLASAAASAAPVPASSAVDKPVTLRTPKQQEVFTFLRPNFPERGKSLDKYTPSRRTHPDIPDTSSPQAPFYRPEPLITFANLPHLRPRVLYIFADQSPLSVSKGARDDKLKHTGTGVGGSGGVEEGTVKEAWIKDAGHFVPFEKPGKTADLMVGWLREEQELWERLEVSDREAWAAVSLKEKTRFSENYVHWIKETFGPAVRGLKKEESKSKI